MTTDVWDFSAIDLKDVNGCLREIESCANGLAYLDHLYGRVLDDVDEHTVTWEATEAEAAEAAREDAPSGVTATEIRGSMTQYVNKRPSARKVRDELAEAKRRQSKIERWARSLEKRMSAAQSASNAHQNISKATDPPGNGSPSRAGLRAA